MSTASHGKKRGLTEVVADDNSLVIAASHEMTSPLVLLRQLGLSIAAEGLIDSDRRLLGERMTLTSERALRMAASLAMTSLDQRQLELEPLNPLSICQEVVHELSPLFVAHGQSLTLKQRTRIPLLVGDRRLLQQILLSFGDNALYYGSDIHPVRLSIAAHGDRVRISMRDFGPAVPIDIWSRLEQLVAHRAVMPLASRPHLSSVGLIAAKRLAEMMGSAVGTIRHQDGATFYVDLHVSGQMSLL